MAQFYFLSVLFTILAGLILVYGRDLTLSDDISMIESGDDEKRESVLFKDFDGFNNATFRLVIGILSVFVGIMKLLASYDGIIFAGDLIPALAGLASGASLLIEYYVTNSSDPEAVPESVQGFFIGFRKYIGVLCLVVGLLHFIFPQILFL